MSGVLSGMPSWGHWFWRTRQQRLLVALACLVCFSVLGAESRELLLDELNQHQHSRGGITHVRIKTLDHNNRYKPSHWSRLDDGGETNERLPRGLQDSVRAHHPRAHIIEKGAMLTIVTPASIIPVTSTTVRPLTTTTAAAVELERHPRRQVSHSVSVVSVKVTTSHDDGEVDDDDFRASHEDSRHQQVNESFNSEDPVDGWTSYDWTDPPKSVDQVTETKLQKDEKQENARQDKWLSNKTRKGLSNNDETYEDLRDFHEDNIRQDSDVDPNYLSHKGQTFGDWKIEQEGQPLLLENHSYQEEEEMHENGSELQKSTDIETHLESTTSPTQLQHHNPKHKPSSSNNDTITLKDDKMSVSNDNRPIFEPKGTTSSPQITKLFTTESEKLPSMEDSHEVSDFMVRDSSVPTKDISSINKVLANTSAFTEDAIHQQPTPPVMRSNENAAFSVDKVQPRKLLMPRLPQVSHKNNDINRVFFTKEEKSAYDVPSADDVTTTPHELAQKKTVDDEKLEQKDESSASITYDATAAVSLSKHGEKASKAFLSEPILYHHEPTVVPHTDEKTGVKNVMGRPEERNVLFQTTTNSSNTTTTVFPVEVEDANSTASESSNISKDVKATTTTITATDISSASSDTSSARAFMTAETPVQYKMVSEVQYQIPLAAAADGTASSNSSLRYDYKEYVDESDYFENAVIPAVVNDDDGGGDPRYEHDEVISQEEILAAVVSSEAAAASQGRSFGGSSPERTRRPEVNVSAVIGISVGAFLFILVGTVGLGAFIYHEKYANKPHTLEERFSSSSDDSEGGAVGGSTDLRATSLSPPPVSERTLRRSGASGAAASRNNREVFRSEISTIECHGFDAAPRDTYCEEMYNLDNDSFLNSLENVVIPPHSSLSIRTCSTNSNSRGTPSSAGSTDQSISILSNSSTQSHRGMMSRFDSEA